MKEKKSTKNQEDKDLNSKSNERPTLKSIATITNLGVTTVSRALKDAPDIGESTKQRVREVASRIGYRPNRAGFRLRTGKTMVISVVLSLDEEISGLSSQMMIGLSERFADTPYHLILTPYSRAQGSMHPVEYIVESGSADGLILSGTRPKDERVRYLHERNIPFVTHGRTDMGITHPYVDFDNQRYTSEAVKRLEQKNRRKIMLLPPPPQRMFFRHANLGFSPTEEIVGWRRMAEGIHSECSIDEVSAWCEQLMRNKNKPDGIICMSSSNAIGVVTGLEAAGLELGQDVDLVSKQTVNILTRFRPQIEVVFEDVRYTGQELATAVLGSIDGVDMSELQTVAYEHQNKT